MKAPGLPADQQFFADLFSGLVLNPQLLGRVWFASQPASLPVGSLCIDFPRLDIVLRGEYGNLLEAKQQRMVEGEMLFIPARAANLPINNKPVMLLSLVFAPTWLGLSFYDSRTTSLLHPARQIQLPSLQRGEGEAMLTALTHLSRSPLEQNIIQPLVWLRLLLRSRKAPAYRKRWAERYGFCRNKVAPDGILLHSVSVSADRYVRKSGAGSGRKIVERNTQYRESLFES